MSKAPFWNDKQMEMLKLTMMRLDRLSSTPQELSIDSYQQLTSNVTVPQILLNKSGPSIMDPRSTPLLPSSLMSPATTIAIGSQSSLPMNILNSPSTPTSQPYKEPEKRKKQKTTNKTTEEDSMKGSYLEKFYHQVELFNSNITSVQQRIQNMEHRLDTFEQQLTSSLQALKEELNGNREKRKRSTDDNIPDSQIDKREEENISEKKNT